MILLVVFISFFSFGLLQAKEREVATQLEFDAAQRLAVVGDVIVWLPGTFKDVYMDVDKSDIIIKAKVLGETIFTGKSRVSVKGSRVKVEGFQFLYGYIDKENVIETTGDDNVFSQINISGYSSWKYLVIKEESQRVTVVRCNFENRKNLDDKNILSILVNSNQTGNHKVEYCSFKNFKGNGGDMGIEPIRIGVSTQKDFSSKSIIEYCYFTQCNGDGEIISNKSGDNVFRYNTFEDNPVSQLVLRHGDGAYVYGNFFLNGKGGVRIKEGAGHNVYNNYFSGLTDTSIYLQNSKLDPVHNVSVLHNTFVKTAKVRLNGKGDNPPKRVVLANNVFFQPTKANFGDSTNSELWYGNIYEGKLGVKQVKGLDNLDPLLDKNEFGFYQLNFRSPAVNKSSSSYPVIPKMQGLNVDADLMFDVTRNTRPEAVDKKDVGCEEFRINNKVYPRVTEKNTGPDYL